MANVQRSWEPNWILGDMMPSQGRQGSTSLARRAMDPPDSFEFVLKYLKARADYDANRTARGRMAVEVAVLQQLKSQVGIARLIDSNIDKKETDDELFVVTERVHGIDLEEFTKVGAPSLETAIGIIKELVVRLGACHQLGVVHRDIKPCHVILRNGNPQDPVLIDFGLAFNEDAKPDFETASEQKVGNRFIVLSEQFGDGAEKRDSRSDLTQCVGLLFFLTWGQAPRLIFNGKKKSHERYDAPVGITQLPEAQKSRLIRFFDVGFEWDREQRFQSADVLIEALNKLTAPDGTPIETRIHDLIGRHFQKPEVILAAKFDSATQAAGKALHKLLSEISQSHRQFIQIAGSPIFSHGALFQKAGERQISLQLTSPLEHKSGLLKMLIKRRGSEIELTGSVAMFIGGKAISKELASTRISMSDPEFERELIEAAKQLFESCIRCFLDWPNGSTGEARASANEGL